MHLLAPFTTAAAAANCTFEHGIDFFVAGQSPTWTGVADEAACCALCANASWGCPAFTYSANACYIKTDISGRRPDAACVSGTNPSFAPLPPCLGEFTRCAETGECTMSTSSCGRCAAGEYLCPSDQRTCVASAAAYSTCPGMEGTHFDTSLSVEQRLDFLVAKVPLADQIAQLTNAAPELTAFGIPKYQWLNDDQHGVARTPARATIFPNGCALGATFSKPLLHDVGRILGQEARGLHNGFLDSDPAGRSMGCNGCSLTLYAPNLK